MKSRHASLSASAFPQPVVVVSPLMSAPHPAEFSVTASLSSTATNGPQPPAPPLRMHRAQRVGTSSIVNAKSEVTTFTYETNPADPAYGRLLTITGDVAGGNRTFTYDAYGRVRTTAWSRRGTVRAAGRVTCTIRSWSAW